MAHDILSSARVRKRRWRARKRLEKLEAEKAAKAAHRAELDAVRVAAGKLPIAEARREKVRKFRQKQADLKSQIEKMWFAPSLDFDVVVNQRIAESPNLDPSLSRSFVEACARNCRANSLNLNAFNLEHGAHVGNHKRTVFHELIEKGAPLSEAAERCHRETFKPNPLLSGVPQAVDIGRRFDEAQEKWGDGSQIVDELLKSKGRKTNVTDNRTT